MGRELLASRRSHWARPSRVGQALRLDGSVPVGSWQACSWFQSSQAPKSQDLKSGLPELESPR